MRNKANRLEELFMRLVEGRDAGDRAAAQDRGIGMNDADARDSLPPGGRCPPRDAAGSVFAPS
jgi:hypothetical protein